MLADAAPEPDALSTGLAALENCDWRDHGGWLAAAARLAADPATRIDNPAIVLHALSGGLDAALWSRLLDAHLRAVRQPSAPFPQTQRRPRHRLRVGYLVNRDRNPLRSLLLGGLLACHDRQRIEPVVYDLGGHDARPIAAGEANGALLRQIAHLKPHEADGLVRVDDIDILVDMCGLSDPRATTLLLSRPARLHMHLAVHASAAARALPSTAPLPAVAHGPGTESPRRSSCGLPDGGVILCSLAPAWAIGPDTFGAWMEALSGSADSHLLLLNIGDAARHSLIEAAATMRVARSRLHFAQAESPHAQFAIARMADVLAEPLHTTDGRDAAVARTLAQPLVALGAPSTESRPGARALHQAGLGDFAAADRAGYAARLGGLLGAPAVLSQARMRFADAWGGDVQAAFAQWVRALEAHVERTYVERASLASAKGR